MFYYKAGKEHHSVENLSYINFKTKDVNTLKKKREQDEGKFLTRFCRLHSFAKFCLRVADHRKLALVYFDDNG